MSEPLQLKKQLRQSMRTNRRALSDDQQHAAGQAMLDQLKSSAVFNQVTSVALYLAADGEIDPTSVIEYCWAKGKQVYLPVLDPHKHNQLLFIHYQRNTAMCLNKYGIAEPAVPYNKTINANQLDLVLLPLVAFDKGGSRMGMGGGYYDRSFAFKAQHKSVKPTLVGLAHELQRVDKLAVESWDIALSMIATDLRIYNCKP